jgi:hypothetical protein
MIDGYEAAVEESVPPEVVILSSVDILLAQVYIPVVFLLNFRLPLYIRMIHPI